MVILGLIVLLVSDLSTGVEVYPHENVEKFYQYGYQVEDTHTGKQISTNINKIYNKESVQKLLNNIIMALFGLK